MREIEKCLGGGHGCEAGDAVDCLMGEWGAWSTCDVNKMTYRDKRSLVRAHVWSLALRCNATSCEWWSAMPRRDNTRTKNMQQYMII